MTSVDLTALGERIERPDEVVGQTARAHLSRLTLPGDGLGRLGDLVVWLARTQGRSVPRPLERVTFVVFAADHGVAAAQVSAWPADASRWIADRFVDGVAPASCQASRAGVPVRLVDVGLGRPSGRIDREDALSAEAVQQALAAGIATADQEIDGGAQLLVLGDLGVASTTPAAAVVGLLTRSDAAAVTGRGSGIDDGTWMRKAAAVRDAMRRGRPVLADHPALLATSGGADLAAITGFLLQAAARRTPVVLDGLVSSAAALLAHRVSFRAVDWWVAAHRSADPAHTMALDRLSLDPVLDLRLSLGEGVGALSVVPLLQVASSLLSDVRPWQPAPDGPASDTGDATVTAGPGDGREPG
jgi:nicotinate-nucleotide--dimethylbenzimidazole phosphoribosyltransferase